MSPDVERGILCKKNNSDAMELGGRRRLLHGILIQLLYRFRDDAAGADGETRLNCLVEYTSDRLANPVLIPTQRIE